ncbi:dnaJ domain-containing protein isoform X2 [Oratosquilla oratoria]|uniref:dnaJ domain-containing protein isoform X2 n=1 Tax=Oratosquilla oratoria TaxID=337810 RepID=UPI003F76C344
MKQAEQIQAEYRIRALEFHPDKNTDKPDALTRFQLLQEAKETLCDPEKRAKYDKWKNSGIAMSYKSWCSISERSGHSFHWAKPPAPERMLGDGEPGARNVTPSPAPRASETVRLTPAGEAWQRESSDIIKKFRNYEI